MFEDFMDHRCNLYHLHDVMVDSGYGIKVRTEKAYRNEPDVIGQPCHFHRKAAGTVRIRQDEPFSTVEGEVKLTLPHDADIRMNDAVEDCESGLKYRAGPPKSIHGKHHIIVTLYREGGVKSAV